MPLPFMVKWSSSDRLPCMVQADIWSFGMLLYEVVALEVPYRNDEVPEEMCDYLASNTLHSFILIRPL